MYLCIYLFYLFVILFIYLFIYLFFPFCVSNTKCKLRNAIAEVAYSCICHGEQRGCHVVYYRRG